MKQLLCKLTVCKARLLHVIIVGMILYTPSPILHGQGASCLDAGLKKEINEIGFMNPMFITPCHNRIYFNGGPTETGTLALGRLTVWNGT
jgi:hypothetical protein